jgi:L-ribulose-5-phosphate 3-epimerase
MMYVQTAATLCFKPYNLDEALAGLAQAGFRNVEIEAVKDWCEHLDPDDLSPHRLAQARALLDRYHLKCVSLAGHSQLHTDEGLRRLESVVRAAPELGAKVVNTFTGDASTSAERAAFVSNVRRIGDVAASLEVMICIETDSNLVPTASAAVPLIAEIGHPQVRINYDTGNVIYYAGAAPAEDLENALALLGHVHLKDKRGGAGVFDFPPLGDGEVPVPTILKRLRKAQFDGPVSLEIEYDGSWPAWETCVEDVARAKSFWDRAALESSDPHANA